MKKLHLLFLLFLLSSNSYADALCNDGWISKSSGSGTCSWHGGVKKWLNKKKKSNGGDIYFPDNDYDRDQCKRRIPGETKQECIERKNYWFQLQMNQIYLEIIENEKQNEEKWKFLKY